MNTLFRMVAVVFFVLALLACGSDNEHFCARYQYVYNQLLEDDLPSYDEMKPQLIANMNNPKKDKEQAKFMLFVLEDWRSEIKPPSEPVKDFCMRVKRWKYYD